MVDWLGVPEGIESGVRMGLAIDQSRMQKQAFQRQMKREDLQMAVEQFKLGRLLQDDARQQAQHKLRAAQHYAQQLQDRVKAGEQIGPQDIQRGQQMALDALNYTYSDYLNQNAEPGTRKLLEGFVPTGRGTVVPKLAIVDEQSGRKIKSAPMTPNRSSDDMTVLEIPAQDVVDVLPFTNDLLHQLDSALVSAGDYSPIEQRNAANATAQEQMFEMAKIDRRGLWDMRKERLKQHGESGKIPDYEKQFSRLASQAFGSTLGADGISFTGKKRYEAAFAAELARRIYLSQPEGQRSTTDAWNQALSLYREHGMPPEPGSREEAVKKGEAEARWWWPDGGREKTGAKAGEAWDAEHQDQLDAYGQYGLSDYGMNAEQVSRPVPEEDESQPGNATIQDQEQVEIPPKTLARMPVGQKVTFEDGPWAGRSFIKQADGTVTEVK